MDIKLLLNQESCNGPQCRLCKKTFHNDHAKKRHIQTVHTAAIRCLYCSKSLKIAGRPDLLKQHLVRCKPFKKVHKGNINDRVKIEYKQLSESIN